MPGVSWTQRQPTDWLASNGRWYAASKYPRGWSTSALPPAPGHGDVGSILRRFVETAVDSGTGAMSRLGDEYDDFDDDQDHHDYDDVEDGDHGGRDWASGFTVASHSSGPAQPTAPPSPNPPGSAVVATGRRVADATISEPPPPDASLPAPPGRISQSSNPPPPTQAATNVVPAPTPKSSFEVVAGDLGTVLGSAKRRIEEAINESAER